MKFTNRTPLIAGNWKMHKTIEESVNFIQELIPLIQNISLNVYLAVPFTALYSAANEAKGSPLLIGAQNMNDANEGAFTGEISAIMLKDAGAQFVILGHSERRHLFHETNAFIHRKIRKALLEGLKTILCIGETEEERKNKKTEEVLHKQLEESLGNISAEQVASIIIAYEPVWAIGSAHGAIPEQAQLAAHFCRQWICHKWGEVTAQKVIIQYGGSVHPQQAKEFMDQPDVDGLLVGGASLNVESFNQIIHY